MSLNHMYKIVTENREREMQMKTDDGRELNCTKFGKTPKFRLK